ncbi:LAME_0F06436g1_1 [Lachancea meyersii CBS 8951]|uniref:LAME_0F06436g1_1 n=1 Tax=Lachancea meyersii CBS 8951 TaxID=1266667 RepID=A0A1G4JTH8_9SACH|nr:LAME_0F06436g1_1 [Lachancea meyersii CBS 8951]
MTTQLAASFAREADEYVSRMRFRRRLRAWLSESNTWLGCLDTEKRSTQEYSYDTEQLDFLLLLNGLKRESISSAESCASPAFTEASQGSTDVKSNESKPQASKRRFFELGRRLRSALRRSCRSKTRLSSQNNASSTTKDNYSCSVTLPEIKDGERPLSLHSSRESYLAPSTNVLNVLKKLHPTVSEKSAY